MSINMFFPPCLRFVRWNFRCGNNYTESGWLINKERRRRRKKKGRKAKKGKSGIDAMPRDVGNVWEFAQFRTSPKGLPHTLDTFVGVSVPFLLLLLLVFPSFSSCTPE